LYWCIRAIYDDWKYESFEAIANQPWY
jgi:hypothetical protein